MGHKPQTLLYEVLDPVVKIRLTSIALSIVHFLTAQA